MPLNTAINLLRVEDAMRELDAPDTDYLKVESLINAASAWLEGQCRRPFKQRTVTLILDGDASVSLDLRASPIQAVTSVVIDWDGPTPVALANPDTAHGILGDYRIISERGQLFRRVGWIPGVQNIQVICTIGLADADIPEPIRRACMMLVSFWYHNPGTDLQEEKIGEYSYRRFDRPDPDQEGVSPEIHAIVLAYRRWDV